VCAFKHTVVCNLTQVRNVCGMSCRRVALYAVDSLRQLVAKLLARAELEHFTHQEEALRPFVAVLRQCDEACVRELAVQCIMQVLFDVLHDVQLVCCRVSDVMLCPPCRVLPFRLWGWQCSDSMMHKQYKPAVWTRAYTHQYHTA
jgi:hypothetical protein